MIPKRFQTTVDKMPALLSELKSCQEFSASPASNFPKKPGIYAFYIDKKPIYVGRSKNIRQRIQNHIGGRPEQSSFAFKLTRINLNRPTTYTPNGSREQLMKDPEFQIEFSKTVKFIKSLVVRYAIIDDEIDQYLFELYASLALDTTRYNQFGTS